MSFLHRRSLAPLAESRAPLPAVPPPRPRAIENIPRPSTAPHGGRPGAGLIKRVSAAFAHRKKRPPSLPCLVGANISVSLPFPSRGSTSPVESVASEDDIRRPSGLGRSVSIHSNQSCPPSPLTVVHPASPFDDIGRGGHERTRAVSTPNLLRAISIKVQAKLERRSSDARPVEPVRPRPVCPDIPPEIVAIILSFLPRQTVVSLALVCRAFCSGARLVLYRTLDLRTIRPNRFEQLVALLASCTDLTDLVESLICHAWPPFFSPRVGHGEVHTPIFSSFTATFTIAFQRMHNLKSLELPSFDPSLLRHHSAFGLERLTFMNRGMSSDEAAELFTWLDGQANITHLAFPNLIEKEASDTHSINNDTLIEQHTNLFLFPAIPGHTPNPTPKSSTFPLIFSFPSPPSPFRSSTLLPGLSTLHATPSIVSLLASTRPVQTAIVNIHSTLYTGLRPAALMATLHGISTLECRFGENVDRRTVEKVLGAAGAALGRPGGDADGAQGLQTLEVELAGACAGLTDALYKIVHTVLPRYRALHTLCLRFSFTSASSSIRSSTSTDLAYVFSQSSDLSDQDRILVASWVKQCPSLRSITLLSGATWRGNTANMT